MTLTILRSVSGVCCKMPLWWNLTFSHDTTVYMGSWEEGHGSEMPFSSYCTIYVSALLSLSWSSLRWCLSVFSAVDLFPSPFPYCILWKGVAVYSSHLRSPVGQQGRPSSGDAPSSWRWSIYLGYLLHRRTVSSPLFIYLFNHLCISV